MKLQDKLDKLRDNFETGRLSLVPTAEQIETIHRTTKTLIDTGQAGRALKTGDHAPDFSLSDPEGKPYNLRELLVSGPIVLTFYRGVWCPFCNLDLAALEAERGEIEARGAHLVAISPQTHANSRRSQRDNKLNFPILSDPDSKVAETFGLRPICLLSLLLYMLLDPLDEEIRNLDILFALHEHVRATLYPFGRERDEGDVTAGGFDLLHFLGTGCGWITAKIVANNDQDRHLSERPYLLVRQVREAASFELDQALNPASAF